MPPVTHELSKRFKAAWIFAFYLLLQYPHIHTIVLEAYDEINGNSQCEILLHMWRHLQKVAAESPDELCQNDLAWAGKQLSFKELLIC